MSELSVSFTHKPLRGTVRVPADKSISHRAALLSALADGETRVENFLSSQTTQATLNCLRALGVSIEQPARDVLVIGGRGPHGLREPDDVLFCAGSGTTLRLLAGVCAGQSFLSILDGAPALKRRPMARVVEPLRAMGATILARHNGQLPPLAIRGGGLRGIDYDMPVASAQVKSALLLAGLFADGPTTVREPGPSRDHTERMLRAFGVNVETVDCSGSSSAIRVYPFSILHSPLFLSIPGDFSSAAFLMVAALLAPQSELCIEHVGVNPTRIGLLDVLRQMGATIELEDGYEQCHEPAAHVIARASDLQGVEIGGETVVRMIDEFPILAVAATQAHGTTVVRDAQELRVKESDRVATLAQELSKMGAHIQERADGFTITGPSRLCGAKVSAHNDHRLAMSLAVAGLIAEGVTQIDGWECVNDSFPDFQETLEQLL